MGYPNTKTTRGAWHLLPLGERIPQKKSPIEPLNLAGADVFSLSSSGGEGWGEEAHSLLAIRRLIGRERPSLACWRRFTLSPRERAGVRGNGPFFPQTRSHVGS